MYLGWERGRTVELQLDMRRDIEAAQQRIRTSREGADNVANRETAERSA